MTVFVTDTLKPKIAGLFKVIETEDLGGEFVSKIERAVATGDITVTYQKSDDTEDTLVFHTVERGAWVAGRAYKVGDIASYNSKSYWCIQATSGTQVPDYATSDDWVVIEAHTEDTGLNEAEVDARIAAGTQDWSRDTTTPLPQDKLINAPANDSIVVARDLPALAAAVPTSLYGKGNTYADSLYWTKRVIDRTHIILEADYISDVTTGNNTRIGWSNVAGPANGGFAATIGGVVHRPWTADLGITRLYVGPGTSGSTWSITLETVGATTPHNVGFILSALAGENYTLFRVAGTAGSAAVYRSSNYAAALARPIVAGGIYRLQLRYSGGQHFIDVHDADFFAEIASRESVAQSALDDAVKLDVVRARVQVLETASAAQIPVDLANYYTKTEQGRIDDALEISTEKSDEAIRDIVVTRTTADDDITSRQFTLPGSAENEAIAIVTDPTLTTNRFAANFAVGTTGHALTLTGEGVLFAKLLLQGKQQFYRVRIENAELETSFLLPGSTWRYHTETNLHKYFKIADFNFTGYTVTMEYLANATDKPNSTYYGIPERVEDWSIKDDATLIPKPKLANADGLNQASVDLRVVAGTQDWARDTTTDIPANKLGNQGDNPADWATDGNTTDKVPDDKIPANIPRRLSKVVVQTSGDTVAPASGNNTTTLVLSLDITPTSASNKILLEVIGGSAGLETATVSGGYYFNINRGITSIITVSTTIAGSGLNNQGALSSAKLDSPNTTDTITYTMSWGCTTGGVFKGTDAHPVVIVATEIET